MADWLSALGQVVGAIGTFAAVVVALWLARRDGRRQQTERADRQAGQARLIITDIHRSESVVGSPAELPILTAGQAIDRAIASESGHPADGEVVVRFLDAAGLRWRRTGTAQPQRLL